MFFFVLMNANRLAWRVEPSSPAGVFFNRLRIFFLQSVGLVTFLLPFVSGAPHAFAQSTDNGPDIPPAPRSREFEKWINYPVSLHNGLVKTDVPIYEIELDGVVIPIGISYHASGLAFGQTNGDVGLGWQLNPGYRVSRTVRGRLDEAYDMPDMNNVAGGQPINVYLSNNFSTPFDRDQYVARYFNVPPDGEIPAIIATPANHLDGQYDLFTFGLPGQSGHFIITDRVSKTTTTLDNSAISQISYQTGTNGISEINATDRNGVSYQFGVADPNNEGRQVFVNGAFQKYNTGWMLSEINTVFGNSIDFQYQTISESSYAMPAYSRTLIEGGVVGMDCHSSIDNNGVFSAGSSQHYTSQVLTSITTPFEIVTFNRNTNSMVASIVVSRSNGGEQLKKADFFYSGAGRIFLDSIQVTGSAGPVVETYRFDYYQRPVSYENYTAFGLNLTGITGGDNYAPLYGPFTYGKTVCPGPSIPENVLFGGLHKAGLPSGDAGMLRTVVFPGGGFRRYAYAPHVSMVNSALPDIAGNGLRIASIVSNDGITGNTLLREYLYDKGVMSFDPTRKEMNVTEKRVLASGAGGGGTTIIGSVRTFTHSSLLAPDIMEALAQPGFFYYPKVTERFANGKIEHYFEVANAGSYLNAYPTNPGITSFHPVFLGVYHYWNQPFLTEKIVYQGPHHAPVQVRKETFEYFFPSGSPSEAYTGFKVSPYALADSRFGSSSHVTAPLDDLYTNAGIQSVFNYATYQLTKGDILLRKKTATDYGDGGGQLTTIAEFTYTNFNLVASEKTTTSSGEVTEVRYKYPFNFTGLTASDDITTGAKNLSALGVVSPVLETATYLRNADGSNNRLTNASFKSYKPSLPVPDKVFEVEMTAPLTDFSESGVSGGALTRDSRYVERFSYDLYNAKGKLLQAGKPGGMKTLVFWGYNDKYPVANVAGSNYATAGGSINQAILDNTPGSYTDAQIRNELNNLRNIANTLVHTFTYAPLIGVNSITDPGGQTTLYEYDPFNRLETVKTSAGLVRASYCYNYTGQTVPCTALAPTGSIAASFLSLIPEERSPPLPVSLLAFEVAKVEEAAYLTWTTTDETNSDHYLIERSKDGTIWATIGRIEATGESNQQVEYRFTDDQPARGLQLYRLKMIDKDQSFAYSPIKSLQFGGDAVLFPNPVSVGEQLNIQLEDFSQITDIRVYGAEGTLKMTTKPTGVIDLKGLSSGLYVVQITYVDGSMTTHRVIKH